MDSCAPLWYTHQPFSSLEIQTADSLGGWDDADADKNSGV
jgi:hypothetical protein